MKKKQKWANELEVAIQAAKFARSAIMNVYNEQFDVEIKEDDSPVTMADKLADIMIRNFIANKFKKHAFLTEESQDTKERLKNNYVWIVDPVDGTKDFVARDGDFTTNIALAYKHELVVGVVLVPLTGEIYYASKGGGAFYVKDDIKEQIHVNDKLDDLIVLKSKFHCNEEEENLIKKHNDKIKHQETYGSSVKPCRIARGLAEITYRMSPNTKEWDTAAAQIIVEEAGGIFVKPDGSPIKYNREDVYNREGYVVANRKENLLV